MRTPVPSPVIQAFQLKVAARLGLDPSQITGLTVSSDIDRPEQTEVRWEGRATLPLDVVNELLVEAQREETVQPDYGHDPCGCPRNPAGDIRCHRCGEMVNRQCWKCGTPRGEGPCPTQRRGQRP